MKTRKLLDQLKQSTRKSRRNRDFVDEDMRTDRQREHRRIRRMAKRVSLQEWEFE